MSDPFRSDLEAAHHRIERLEADHEKRVAELEEENRRLRARLTDHSTPKNRRNRVRVVLPAAMIALGMSLAVGMMFAHLRRPIAFDAPLPGPMQLQEIGEDTPTVEAPVFDRSAVSAALSGVRAQDCAAPGGPHGPGHVKITFAPSGIALKSQVDQAPYTGTTVGECVASRYRDVRVPAFVGAPVTVGKSFDITE